MNHAFAEQYRRISFSQNNYVALSKKFQSNAIVLNPVLFSTVPTASAAVQLPVRGQVVSERAKSFLPGIVSVSGKILVSPIRSKPGFQESPGSFVVQVRQSKLINGTI